VKTLYAEAVAGGKITPEFIAANTNLAVYAAQILPRRAQIKKGAEMLQETPAPASRPEPAAPPATKPAPPADSMEALLLATFPVNDGDLAALAANRAKAVQAYLLQTGKVEAARIFLKAGGVEALRRDGSRAYLQFQ
jgi:hypothetical protein